MYVASNGRACKQASKQASEQASKRASKRASKQASKRASKQASEQASKQASKQASERSFIVASSVRSILYYIVEDRTREAGVAANDDNMPREVLAIVDRTLGQHISNHLMHTGIVVPAQPGVE
jgi:sRNA-binding protein